MLQKTGPQHREMSRSACHSIILFRRAVLLIFWGGAIWWSPVAEGINNILFPSFRSGHSANLSFLGQRALQQSLQDSFLSPYPTNHHSPPPDRRLLFFQSLLRNSVGSKTLKYRAVVAATVLTCLCGVNLIGCQAPQEKTAQDGASWGLNCRGDICR